MRARGMRRMVMRTDDSVQNAAAPMTIRRRVVDAVLITAGMLNASQRQHQYRAGADVYERCSESVQGANDARVHPIHTAFRGRRIRRSASGYHDAQIQRDNLLESMGDNPTMEDIVAWGEYDATIKQLTEELRIGAEGIYAGRQS